MKPDYFVTFFSGRAWVPKVRKHRGSIDKFPMRAVYWVALKSLIPQGFYFVEDWYYDGYFYSNNKVVVYVVAKRFRLLASNICQKI